MSDPKPHTVTVVELLDIACQSYTKHFNDEDPVKRIIRGAALRWVSDLSGYEYYARPQYPVTGLWDVTWCTTNKPTQRKALLLLT